MTKKDKDELRFTTEPFTLSFPIITEKQLNASKAALLKHGAKNVEDTKYSVEMLFDRDDEHIKKIGKMLTVAAKAAFPDADKDEIKAFVKARFKDGNVQAKKGKEGYKGKIYLKVNSSTRPGVVDHKGEAILDLEKEFYAGCIARATVSAFGYTAYGGGVTLVLHNLQKLKEGDPMGAPQISAEDDFAELGGDDEEDYDDNDDLLGDIGVDDDEEDAA